MVSKVKNKSKKKKDKDFKETYNGRGIAYANLKKYEEAIANFNKAIGIDENNKDAYNNRGNVYSYLKKYKEAIADYNKTIGIDEDFKEAYNGRGIAYSYLKKYEEAIADYNKVIKLNPKGLNGYYNRGILYKNMGVLDKALDDYNKAFSKTLEDINKNYKKISYLYENIKYFTFKKLKELSLDSINNEEDIKWLELGASNKESLKTALDFYTMEENIKLDIEAISKDNNVKYIASLEELSEYIIKLSKTEKHYLFRGVNRAFWDLTPSIFRGKHEEEKLLENFKREAPSFSDIDFNHYEKIDYLSLMQHSGTPTKLLDWTQSFMIALFFAFYQENREDINSFGVPCIYIVDSTDLIKTYEDVRDKIKGIEGKNREEILFFAPYLNHKRAQVQQSIFSYHLKMDAKIDDQKVERVVFNPYLKDEVMNYLAVNGITISSIYPDLEHLSQRLKEKSNANLNYTKTLRNQEISSLEDSAISRYKNSKVSSVSG